jgi:ubiquinone/menaquinone biosynthesis C-methylase UbiE
VDFDCEKFPWPDASMDAVTCMHVIEHLQDVDKLLAEMARLLKPGGRAYFETPHEKSLDMPSAKGQFTLNFFDDPTHIRVVTMNEFGDKVSKVPKLKVIKSGISRNLFFASTYPFLYLSSPSRKRYTAQVHWIGWSAYLIFEKVA